MRRYYRCGNGQEIKTVWSYSLWTCQLQPTSLKRETKKTTHDVTGRIGKGDNSLASVSPIMWSVSLWTWHLQEVLNEANVILCLWRQLLEAPSCLGAAAPAGQSLVLNGHPRQNIHVCYKSADKYKLLIDQNTSQHNVLDKQRSCSGICSLNSIVIYYMLWWPWMYDWLLKDCKPTRKGLEHWPQYVKSE